MTQSIPGSLNNLQLNEWYVNQPPVQQAPCYGITLTQLRQRLRAMLSSYAPSTLIPNGPDADLELQYINDGIGLLWPHDYRVDFQTFPIIDKRTHYIMDLECEFVFGVYTSEEDLSSGSVRQYSVPHYDGWMYDDSYFELANVTNPENDTVWVNQTVKAVRIVDPYTIGSDSRYKSTRQKFLAVRYARRWPSMVAETDCINPSANRIQAIIFYAAHEYITSQFEVNSESIRYQNYMGIANRFYQQYMQMLVKDSKPLYIS